MAYEMRGTYAPIRKQILDFLNSSKWGTCRRRATPVAGVSSYEASESLASAKLPCRLPGSKLPLIFIVNLSSALAANTVLADLTESGHWKILALFC
jgi:hypothetical protein